MADKVNNEPFLWLSLARQAWLGLALWMAAGLLFEGLIGFRSPAYLQDPIRRELLRLAHAHGTLFSILLIVVDLWIRNTASLVPNFAVTTLRIGTVLMPVGFLLGGIWHTATDPGVGVFLAPVGGAMVIFGVIAIGLSSTKRS
jgi:hypothetical protein